MNTLRIPQRVSLFLLVPVLVLGLGACTDKPQQQADETGNAAQGEMAEFKQNFRSSLSEADRTLEQVGQRVEAAGENAQGEMQQELKGLHQRRKKLGHRLNKLEASGEKEIQQARTDLQSRLNEFERDLRIVRLQTMESKEEFVQAVQTQMEEIDRQMAQLEQRLEGAGADLRGEYKEKLTTLREERKALNESLAELEQAGSEKFAQMKETVAEDVAALRAELDQWGNEQGEAINSQTASRDGGNGQS